MSSGIEVEPRRVEATPGTPVRLTATVRNDDAEPRAHRVRIVGSDSSWSGEARLTPVLAPGEAAALEFDLRLPLGFPGGEHLFGIESVPLDRGGAPLPGRGQVADVVVVVGSLQGLHGVMEPQNVDGSRRARTTISLRNRSNTPLRVELDHDSPGGDVGVRFDRDEVVIAPGHVVPIRAKLTSPRNLRGQPRRIPFTVTASGGGQQVHLDGTYQQQAVLRGGVLKALAILAVLAVWASTLTYVFDRVSDDGDQEQASGEQAGSEGEDGDGTSADGSDAGGGGVDSVDASGKVTAREPQGVEVRLRAVSLVEEVDQGASGSGSLNSASPGVKLFGRRGGVLFNRVVPEERTTATDRDGRWGFAGVTGPGFYELRFSKPGFQTAAYIVEVSEEGEPITLDTELVAGDGAMSGTITDQAGNPLGGVDITVTDGVVTLTARTATTGNVGSWTVEGLDTPGSYLVSASRRGFGTGTALVSLAGGQARTGVDIRLQSGVGTILGTVNSPLGPLGGITVTAVDGDLVRTTSTLTEGPIGTFSLPQLPVPGTYTLTVEGNGWLTQTRDVTLTGDEARVDIDMVASTAVIYGRLTDAADGSPVGGAGITATSGANVFKNTTAPDGTYELAGLPPGTYVIEFERFEFDPGSALVTVGAGGLREVDVALNRRTQLDPTPDNSLAVTVSAEGVLPENIYVTVTDRESGKSATTGGSGGNLAVLEDLPPGVRTLDIERTPGAPTNAAGLQGTSVTVQMSLNGAQTVSVALKPLVSVDLRVQDVNGAALGGAHVVIQRLGTCPPSGCLVYDGNTNANGAADPVPGVADGLYAVTVTLPGFRAFNDGQYPLQTFAANVDTRPTEPVVITLQRLGAMQFDIVEPQGTTSFTALDDVDIALTALSSCAVTTMSATTDTHPYLLSAIEPCTWSATLSKTGYRTVVVSPITTQLNQVTPVSAVMVPQPGVTTGRLVWEPGGGEAARPVAGASVTVDGVAGYNRTPNGLTQIPGTWNGTTDANGVFTFPAETGPVDDTATFTFSHTNFATRSVTDVGGTDIGTTELDPLPGSLAGQFILVQGGTAEIIDPLDVAVTIVDSPDGTLDNTSADTVFATGMVGNYNFYSLPAGRYVVRATYGLGGYTPAEITVVVEPNTPLIAPAMYLEERGSVAVTVREVLDPAPGATPVGTLGGATVGLRDADGVAIPGVADVTLGAGESLATFDDLDAGTYTVIAYRDGYVLRPGDPISVGIGSEVGADVVLRKLTWVTGVLMGDRGGSSNVPLGGIDLVITQAGVEHPATTDATGAFSITDLDAGTAVLTADVADYEPISITLDGGTGNPAALTAGETRDLGTIVTDVLRGSVAGRVVSTLGTDDPPAGLTVVLTQGANVVAQTSFDADTGEFSYTNLLPGAYELSLSAPNHLTQSQPINVQAGQDTALGDIDLTFARSSVNGEVVLRVGSTYLADSDMAGTTVELVDVSDDSSVSTTTAAGGLYSFSDIDDGTYRIRASRDGYQSALSNTVTLDEGRVVPIGQLTLNALTRNVTVTVTTAVGDAALVGASVKLTPIEFSTGVAPASSVTTGTGGVATFTSLVPGGYTATVDGSAIGHYGGSAGFTLAVSASPTTAFAVEIQEARVHGTISIEDANPDPEVVTTPNGVEVTVYDGSGNSLATTEITGATGATATFQLWVPATAREVRASVMNYFTEVRTLTETDVEAGDTKDLGTIPMVPTGSFTITVTDDETDDALEGASIWYRRGSSGAFVEASGTTAADGTLSVSGLRTSTVYEWYATADDYLSSAAAEITPTVAGAAGSASLTPTGSATISVSGGSGGWSVTLTNATHGSFDGSSTNGSSITIDDLPTGTYTVAATRGSANWEGSGSVEVPHGDTGTTTITVSNPNSNP